MATELPPNYSVQDRQAESSGASRSPQIVITPVTNAVQFQTGNLGVEGEHAALEGEVQLKGYSDGEWVNLTVTFKTEETTPSQTVELASCKVELYSKTGASSSRPQTLPSALPFSIHLMPDIPQAITTPTSSVSHSLVAALHPANPLNPPVISSVPVQIKRYTTPLAPHLNPAPRTMSFDSPTPLSIQLPRAVFRVGEPIPVYITVPPPDRALLNSGLRLRNLKTELVRVVKVGPVEQKAVEGSSSGTGKWEISKGTNIVDDSVFNIPNPPIPEKGAIAVPPPLQLAEASGSATSAEGGNIHTTVITRTGASCRFHSSRPVQLRPILHSNTGNFDENENDAGSPDVDTAAGSITQSTVLHDVSFHIHVEFSFVTQASHTSTSVHGRIPIIMIPPLAQQIDVLSEDLEENYMKKHDKPPTKTNRVGDDGVAAPPAFEDSASSSIVLEHQSSSGPSVDPPPFTSEPGGSTLPTFLESEAAAARSNSPPTELRFPGEGTAFGFKPEDQYDGLSHSFPASSQSTSAPPTVEVRAAGLVHLMNQAAAEGRIVDPITVNNALVQGLPPPPPPAMDDPLDPPPAIDDGFHSISRSALERETLAYEAASQVEHHSGHPHPPPTAQIGATTNPPSTHPPPYLGAPGNAPVGPGAPPSYLDSR